MMSSLIGLRRPEKALAMALLCWTCVTATATEPGKCDYSKGEVLKLRFLPSGLPLLDGAINGAPVTFLLDTGAAQTNLLRPKLKELKIAVSKPMSTAAGIGGVVRLSMTRLNSLDFGSVHFDKPYFFVMGDLHPELVGQFDAILGMESLAANDFEVDIASGTLTIFKGLCAQDHLVAWEQSVVELPMNKGRPETSPAQFSVLVQGRMVKAFFDTGAKRSLLDVKLADTLGLQPKPGGEVTYAIGAGGNRVSEWNASVKDIVIGAEKISTADLPIGPMNTGRSDDEFLIGLDYMQSHRILFLPGQGRILVKAGSGSAFAQSRR